MAKSENFSMLMYGLYAGKTRDSYSGSILASQASDAGSIPVSRSRIRLSENYLFDDFSKKFCFILAPQFSKNRVSGQSAASQKNFLCISDFARDHFFF